MDQMLARMVMLLVNGQNIFNFCVTEFRLGRRPFLAKTSAVVPLQNTV